MSILATPQEPKLFANLEVYLYQTSHGQNQMESLLEPFPVLDRSVCCILDKKKSDQIKLLMWQK